MELFSSLFNCSSSGGGADGLDSGGINGAGESVTSLAASSLCPAVSSVKLHGILQRQQQRVYE